MVGELMSAMTQTLELMWVFFPCFLEGKSIYFVWLGVGELFVFFFSWLGINLVIIQIYSLMWFAFQTKKKK